MGKTRGNVSTEAATSMRSNGVLEIGSKAIDAGLAKLFNSSLQRSRPATTETKTPLDHSVAEAKPKRNSHRTAKHAPLVNPSPLEETGASDSSDEDDGGMPYDIHDIINGTRQGKYVGEDKKLSGDAKAGLGSQEEDQNHGNVTHVKEIAGISQSGDSHEPRSRKRKNQDDDDVEGRYMKRLEQEEEKDEAVRQAQRQAKRAKLEQAEDEHEMDSASNDDPDAAAEDVDSDEESENSPPPQHESIASATPASDLERASRTVFLANVSTHAIKSKSSKRALIAHLLSFISSLPEHSPPHAVESLRFRSTAFASASVPKKAAFAKKELMDATTKSTNAYAVYTTALAAREACKKLNGTVVLERHLRVDSVAHPAKQDHRRCVFVGNLGFVDDESQIQAAQAQAKGEDGETPRKTKSRAPGDVEEGLWRQFLKAGEVESVRVVRDKTTRVGKGFAYVQFTSPNAVEKALLFDDQKYPPMLPRKLRVTRAKNITKTASYNKDTPRTGPGARGAQRNGYVAKPNSQSQSLAGRAGKLLGRAGAAQFKSGKPSGEREGARMKGVARLPEDFVFEGYRAKESQGRGTLKLNGKSNKAKGGGKPGGRSSRRGAEFKKAGGAKKRDR